MPKGKMKKPTKKDLLSLLALILRSADLDAAVRAEEILKSYKI